MSFNKDDAISNFRGVVEQLRSDDLNYSTLVMICQDTIRMCQLFEITEFKAPNLTYRFFVRHREMFDKEIRTYVLACYERILLRSLSNYQSRSVGASLHQLGRNHVSA